MKKPSGSKLALWVATTLLVSTLFTAYVVAQTPTSTFWISSGVYSGSPDYTVWREGSEYYAKDRQGALTIASTNFTLVLEAVLTDNHDVYAMRGQYVLDQEFILDGLENASFYGAGIGVTEIFCSSDGGFVKSTGAESRNVIFRDFTLNGAGLNTISFNLNNGTVRYHLFNVEITNSGNFLMYGSVAYELTVESCHFSSSGLSVASDLCAVACHDSTWVNNYFEKTDGNGGACLSSGQMLRTKIVGNTFRNNATYSYASISLENNYNFFTDIVVADNVAIGWNASAIMNIGNSQNYEFTNPTVTGNVVTGGGLVFYRVMGGICSNNHVRNSFYGLYCVNVTNMVFDSNVVTNTAVNGVGALGDKGGFYGSYVYNSTVSNNIIGDTQSPHTTYYGILLSGNHSLIEGNRVSNTLNWGIRLQGTPYACFNNTLAGNQLFYNTGWGIEILAGASHNFLYGNYMTGNGNGNITDAGTNTFYIEGTTGPAGPAGTLEGQQPYDYLVFKNATSTYMINGTTGDIDFSGSDSAVINNACGNGTEIVLAPQTFTLTSSTGISITTNEVRLRGLGDTSIECSGTFNDHIIHVEADYVTIQDLNIDGTNQASSYHGIVEDGNGNGGITVQHVYIEDCGSDGIRLGDTDASWEGNWGKIHHCVIRNNGQYGIFLTYDATDSELLDLLISGHDGVNDAGIRLEADNVRMSTSHLWGNENEMLIADSNNVQGFLCSNVIIADGGGQGGHRILHDSAFNFIFSVFDGCEVWVAKLATTNTYDGFSLTGDTWGIRISDTIFRGEIEVGTNQGRYAIDLDASVHNCTFDGLMIYGFLQSDPIETTGASDITEGTNIVYDCG